jgi:Cu+-exporting ATPase
MDVRDQQAGPAADAGETQQVWVIVRGGYYPCLIEAQAGRPLRLVFDRQEGDECTSRVVFPDFGISASLPAFTQTVVEFTPSQPGAFGFSCGMDMIFGILLVGTGKDVTASVQPQVVAS